MNKKTSANKINIATVRVKTDIEKPMDVELVAEHVKQIAENFDKAMRSGLKKRAIVLLIHDSIPGKSVTMTDIDTVLTYAPLIANYVVK